MSRGLMLLLTGFVLTARALVVEWKDRPITVSVPTYSVLTIEVPCYVQSVVNLSSIKTAFSKNIKTNAVHVAVGDERTSVGITCKVEDSETARSYNIFIRPTNHGGTTYLKIKDEYVRKKSEMASIKEHLSPGEKGILSQAKKLMRAMLNGIGLSGYRIMEGGKSFTSHSFLFTPLYVYSGQLIGVVYKVKNVSPMRQVLSPRFIARKGVVLVWVEGTEKNGEVELRPGEEVHAVVVKTFSRISSQGGSEEAIIPYK